MNAVQINWVTVTWCKAVYFEAYVDVQPAMQVRQSRQGVEHKNHVVLPPASDDHQIDAGLEIRTTSVQSRRAEKRPHGYLNKS